MNRATDSFDAAAAQIARMGQSPATAPGASTTANGDTVDLSSSIVSLLEARNNFEANTKTVTVSEQMAQAMLNMIG
jgi:flagellar hook protein FlgE